MPSPRRVRLLTLVVLAAIITTLFFTAQWGSKAERDTRTIQDFYHRTMNAMDHNRGAHGEQKVIDKNGQVTTNMAKDKDGDGKWSEEDRRLAEDMSSRLRAAEQRAKELANQKAPLKPDAPKKVVGVGSSADGQKKTGGNTDSRKIAGGDDHKVEDTLNEILKRSPVIIFSKTFCPYSKKAKRILLEKYSIDPAPYVVELDEHPLGKQLQAKLGEVTGRTTVPNVMINGKSIGGGDDIAELDTRKTLIDKIKSMGGKRISMKERFVDNSNRRK